MTEQTKPKTPLTNFRRQNPRIDYYPTLVAVAAIERLRQNKPGVCTRELLKMLVVKGVAAYFSESTPAMGIEKLAS